MDKQYNVRAVQMTTDQQSFDSCVPTYVLTEIFLCLVNVRLVSRSVFWCTSV